MRAAYKGIEIFYTDEGRGEPIVFLHGFLENSQMWEGLIVPIKKSKRVICMDLLGHGETGSLGYIHTMEMMAEAVLAVLDDLVVKRAIFVGHSMGGYVTLALAAKEPHRIQKLVLMNSHWNADTPERKMNRDRAIRAVKQNFDTFVNLTIPNLFSQRSRTHFGKQITQVKEIALKTPLQGVIAALEGMKIRAEQKKALSKIAIDTFIIIGKEDDTIDYQQLLGEAEKLGVTPLLLDGGHMSYIENRVEVLLFLAELVHK